MEPNKTIPDEGSLSLFRLQAHFWHLDARQRFSSTETRLYFYLLNRFNAEFWPAELLRWSKQVEADLGLTDKTLATARTSLAARQLLTYREGTKTKAATWALTSSSSNIARNNSGLSSITRNNSEESTAITPDMSRNNSGLYIDKTKTKEEEEKSAAHAAIPPTSFSVEGSEKSISAGRKKKAVALADEVAALPLPFDGELFAQRWATFRAGPKQAKKPLSALELMLTKLGKYPEAFAVEMLEAAIQGDWSGVENPGTAGKYKDWQAQHPAPRPTASPTGPGFSVNALFGLTPVETPVHLDPEALANNKAREEADLQRRTDENRRKREAAAAVQAAQEPSESDTP